MDGDVANSISSNDEKIGGQNADGGGDGETRQYDGSGDGAYYDGAGGAAGGTRNGGTRGEGDVSPDAGLVGRSMTKDTS